MPDVSPAVAQRDTALVLAGAFSKGAFSAGALQVIAEQKLPVRRIVATSAGALNAVVYAAGLRAGRAREATEDLAELWGDGRWWDVLDPSLRQIVRGRGLSTATKLRAHLRRLSERWLPGDGHPIELCIVVTATMGDPRIKERERATSFESVLHFDGAVFDRKESREQLYTAATAAAAFPFVYSTTEVPGLGLCIDGGVVNNNPIRNALESNDRIGRVILITQNPKLYTPPPFQGLRFGEHVVEIAANERLYRDLREAAAVDARLTALHRLHGCGVIDHAQLAAVKEAVGLARARHVEITEIRPAEPLPGSAITGFFWRDVRRRFVEEGRAAAQRILAQPHPPSPPAAGPQTVAPIGS
jgi:NTE family protein